MSTSRATTSSTSTGRSTAAPSRYHLKQYEQETNLVAWLFVDASESMAYGSGQRTKYELACIAAAAMAYLVLNQTDAVGVATLAGLPRAFLRPSGQLTQLREACRVMAEGPFEGPAELGKLLNRLAARTGRRGIVFVFSDILDDAADILDGLQHLRYQKHEVVLFHTLDAAEIEFPFRHTTLFRGLESLPEVLTDPPSIRESYLKAFNEHVAQIEAGCPRWRSITSASAPTATSAATSRRTWRNAGAF